MVRIKMVKMKVDITKLVVYRKNIEDLILWCEENVGEYFGNRNSLVVPDPDSMGCIDSKFTILYAGKNWQIEAVDVIDSYGRTITYYLDIRDEKKAIFFILKFL